MTDCRVEDLLGKYRKFCEKNRKVFDDEFSNNLFRNLCDLFVVPELEKRKGEGRVSDDYLPTEMLIKIIENQEPIIEFDGEIKKMEIAIAAKNFDTINEEVQLPDIKGVIKTNFEKLDDAIQYFYIMKIFDKYHVIANLGDSSQLINSNVDTTTNFTHEELLGALHHLSFAEKIMTWQNIYSDEFEQIGLWAAPSLIPYPLNKIVDLIRTENSQEARTLVINHCDQDFLENLCYHWWKIGVFARRKRTFVNALDAHKSGKYDLAIHALVPQIEGIITDWIYENPKGNLHPFRQESKTKEFFGIVRDRFDEKSLEVIVESTAKFILKGPVLQTFKEWQSNIKNSFANRHIVEHGKYDDSLYSEENSIKLFLLLDTIFYILVHIDTASS
jgi:hypothetical protein